MILKKLKIRNSKGELLVQNVIFLILNLIFLSILFTFVFREANSVANLEEIYSKKIALSLDLAEPGCFIEMDLGDLKEKMDEEGRSFGEVVTISNNLVKIQLEEDSGHSYYFFNNVEVNAYPDKNEDYEDTGLYVFSIN
jgi:hypothetical protein